MYTQHASPPTAQDNQQTLIREEESVLNIHSSPFLTISHVCMDRVSFRYLYFGLTFFGCLVLSSFDSIQAVSFVRGIYITRAMAH
jgi:hypothetical protein